MSQTLNDRLSPLLHPFVLRSAWQKVESWYRSVEMRPEPEYSLWDRNPWARLETLARKLHEGHYQPEPMTEVPYPKNAEQIGVRVPVSRIANHQKSGLSKALEKS